MMKTVTLLSLSLFFTLGHAWNAWASGAPVEEIDLAPAVTEYNGPVELDNAGDAREFFKDDFEKLQEQVDFATHKVVVIAWRGSGQDSIDVAVAESFPEQVTFSRRPGRTRDLGPHVKTYVLRANVTWTANGFPGGQGQP